MRYTLGIDTAGRWGSVALAGDGSTLAWEILPPGEHSGGLSHAAALLVNARGLALRDLSGIAVSSGPGSFTGLRIGLAWAKGVCASLPLNLALVSAHEANAHRHRFAALRIAAVLPGERGSVQVSLWSGGERPAALWGPEPVAADRLEETLRVAAGSGIEEVLIAAPDAPESLRERLEEEGFMLVPENEGAGRSEAGAPGSPPPAGAAVAELGDRALREGRLADPVSAAPAYGRAPNARKPLP